MADEAKYRVGMVSKMTGLSTHTLRMWEKRYATVPVPPLATYKYRAHSSPSAMVYIHYQTTEKLYRWISPRITVTFDSIARAKDSTPFAKIISEELKWLAAEGICTPSSKTLAWLDSLSSIINGGGWCYWSKQDSFLGLNQWFTLGNDAQNGWQGVWKVFSTRGGCGLGTDFELPVEKLGSTGTVVPASVHSISPVPTIHAGIRRGMLSVVSSMLFDNVSICNLLGREVYSAKFVNLVNNASVQMSKNCCSSGNYLIIIRSENRQIVCMPLIYQK